MNRFSIGWVVVGLYGSDIPYRAKLREGSLYYLTHPSQVQLQQKPAVAIAL